MVGFIRRRSEPDLRGQLLESFRPDMLRFALWLARDRSVAEDVVQESMLRAWRSRGELKDAQAARPWLLTIVRREHARLYERKRLPTTALDELPESDALQLAGPDEPELLGLRLAILRLADDYREPLVMQVLGGFSTAEIAAELQLSQSAVLTRLFRARNQLRSLYGLAPVEDVDAVGETP
jgi:RNA polymerase sigma-70 factor (ECF subfamily)